MPLAKCEVHRHDLGGGFGRRGGTQDYVHKAVAVAKGVKDSSGLYEVERQARELSAEERQRIRQLQSRPIADKFRQWLLLHRQKATDGTAIAKAIDYSLGRWQALTRFVDDGALPIDNNWVENRIRPIALASRSVA